MVDHLLAASMTKETMDIEHARPVERAHADGAAGLWCATRGAHRPPVVLGEAPGLFGAGIGSAECEAILAPVALLQAAELNERRGVALGRRTTAPDYVSQFRYAYKLAPFGVRQEKP
jgi:hypothetical protein